MPRLAMPSPPYRPPWLYCGQNKAQLLPSRTSSRQQLCSKSVVVRSPLSEVSARRGRPMCRVILILRPKVPRSDSRGGNKTVECEEERWQVKEKITGMIDEEEWCRRLEEEDGGITTVLGLSGDTKEYDEVVIHMKNFLPHSWKGDRKWEKKDKDNLRRDEKRSRQQKDQQEPNTEGKEDLPSGTQQRSSQQQEEGQGQEAAGQNSSWTAARPPE